MNGKLAAALLAMAGVGLGASRIPAAQKATVTVCMEPNVSVLMGVKPMASAMFARIGVRIDWRELDACPLQLAPIQVRLAHGAPGVGESDALGFARPYEGTVVVFVDRVQELDRNGVHAAMAHVLVHEITHVLEGIDRHSATGVMKAHWSNEDYSEMRRKALPFAPEDVKLIHDGLNSPPRVPSGAAAAVAAVVACSSRTAYR